MKNDKELKSEIVCYGELVVDCFGSISDGFVPKFGGAPGNTAVGISKLGHHNTTFIGKVGADFFGDFMDNTLQRYGVDTRYLFRDKDHKTTLAFVSLSAGGQRDFSFYPGAHEYVSLKDVKKVKLADARIFKFGSLTQSNDICREATDYLLAKARKEKAYISYDPNVRLQLWKNPAELKRVILKTIPKVDMLKINEEEMEFLTGEKDPKKAAQKIWGKNKQLQVLLLTLGSKGAYWKTAHGEGLVKTARIHPIDTTGAGDAFNAAMLSQLFPLIQDGKLDTATVNMKGIVSFANRVASLSTLKKGAIEALPTRDEVARLMESED